MDGIKTSKVSHNGAGGIEMPLIDVQATIEIQTHTFLALHFKDYEVICTIYLGE